MVASITYVQIFLVIIGLQNVYHFMHNYYSIPHGSAFSGSKCPLSFLWTPCIAVEYC